MAEPKFTPAPWSLETVETSSGICHKVGPFPGKRDGDKPRHACLYADYPSMGNPSDRELLANAHLIAAAPELYEALEYALPYLKACVPNPRNGVNADCSVDVNCIDRALAALAKARGEKC